MEFISEELAVSRWSTKYVANFVKVDWMDD